MIALILFLAVLGTVMLVAEVFVPGMILGILGTTALLISLGLCFTAAEVREVGAWVPPLLAAGVVAIGAGGFLISMRYYQRTFLGRMLTLTTQVGGKDGVDQEGERAVAGREGVALTDLAPQGRIEVGGVKYDALAESGLIPLGTRVRVVRRQFGELVVRRELEG